MNFYSTYLKIPDRPAERIIPESPLFVQKLPRFPIDWGAEQAIVEAFFQLLRTNKEMNIESTAARHEMNEQ